MRSPDGKQAHTGVIALDDGDGVVDGPSTIYLGKWSCPSRVRTMPRKPCDVPSGRWRAYVVVLHPIGSRCTSDPCRNDSKNRTNVFAFLAALPR
jgi:hypothetical protein